MTMARVPKVLVFTITYEGKEYVFDKFLEHAKQINYPDFKHVWIDNSETLEYYELLKSRGLEVYHVERGNNTREALARSQNFARELAIKEGYDYLLSLESDVLVPPNIVQLLLVRGKDVISALYFIGDRDRGQRIPCITLPEWHEEGYWGTRLLNPEEFTEYLHNGLQRVQAAGLGCCLIHKRIFNKYAFYYDPRYRGHSDIYFFNQLFQDLEAVWVDTDIVCDHQNKPWNGIKDR